MDFFNADAQVAFRHMPTKLDVSFLRAFLSYSRSGTAVI